MVGLGKLGTHCAYRPAWLGYLRFCDSLAMARLISRGDEGDYEVGNVKIIPFGDNVSEAQMGNQHTIGFKHSPEFRAAQSARMMGNKRALGLV